jgi:hypothetical protein
MVAVACRAARAAGVFAAKMRSTSRRASSAARFENRSILPSAPPVLYGDVSTLRIAELTQPLPEGVELHSRLGGFQRTGYHQTNPGDFRRWLGIHAQRPRGCCAAEKCDEIASLQLIELHSVRRQTTISDHTELAAISQWAHRVVHHGACRQCAYPPRLSVIVEGHGRASRRSETYKSRRQTCRQYPVYSKSTLRTHSPDNAGTGVHEFTKSRLEQRRSCARWNET